MSKNPQDDAVHGQELSDTFWATDNKLFLGAGLEMSRFKPLKLHISSLCIDLRSQGEKTVLGVTFFIQAGR